MNVNVNMSFPHSNFEGNFINSMRGKVILTLSGNEKCMLEIASLNMRKN